MPDTTTNIPEHLLRRDFELHVICNSHLDREWTENFQFTRMLTVRFLDNLLNIMRQVPEYQFLLDSQTLPLEDYLTVRPEAEPVLREYVRGKRLWIGPWYTAPDFSCVFGESIVRNLLIGHRIARDFGHVMKVGYTPFGFGQPSQLPQIYAGFGIDMIWFYRGVSEREVPGICFRWTGADGTEAFCSRANRYNFYFGVMRPLLKGGGVRERDFDYASGQLPIHVCDEERTREHAVLADSRTDASVERVRDLIVALLEDNTKVFPGSVISFMNGMDTSMPTLLDHKVVQQAQAVLPENWRIFHSNLPDFVKAFRAEVEREHVELPTVHGERRDAGAPAPDTTMLGDILLSRPAQKRKNAVAEVRLQRYAEPLAALAWLQGQPYPQTLLDLAWKELCKCHPHDTIAGAGVDALQEDLMHRLDQVIRISEALTQFALGDLIRGIDLGGLDDAEIPLVVFNPSPWPRSEIVQATIDLPHAFGYEGFEIVDGQSGEPVEFAVTRWRPNGERVIRDLYDAPTSFFCSHVDVDLVAADVPALGYRTLIVRKAPRRGYCRSLLTGPAGMENEHLKVAVAADGTLTVTEKLSGRSYAGLNRFRDRGDAGHAWTSAPPTEDSVVLSTGDQLRVSVVHDSPLRATLKVEQVLRVPAYMTANDDYSFTRRSAETVELPITSYVSLTRMGRAVDVRTVIDNRAKHHLLQVLFPTGCDASVSSSDTAFDVVSRGIHRDEKHSFSQTIAPSHPTLRFVHVADGKDGLAVVHAGVRGYQATEDADRAIALSLVRAFEVNMCTVSYRWEHRPDQELSQALGRHEISYAIVPHVTDWKGRVVEEAERVNVPLLIVQAGKHAGKEPRVRSFLTVKPGTIELSCIKKAEQGDAMIIRLFNPSDGAQDTTLTLFCAVKGARLLTLEENPLDGAGVTVSESSVSFRIGPKKIATVELAV
ncbi:MAG: hypothetical protein JXB13_08035 [Phycisphaerae bacterium]|nr:hypothetical protein [Phycisphaerae bacterium]